jgi:hypothetical protein
VDGLRAWPSGPTTPAGDRGTRACAVKGPNRSQDAGGGQPGARRASRTGCASKAWPATGNAAAENAFTSRRTAENTMSGGMGAGRKRGLDLGAVAPAVERKDDAGSGHPRLPATRSNVNSAASKEHPVRDRAGRARHFWAKTAVRAMESGAARNRSGVKETACSEGRSVNRGGPTVPDRDVDSGGSNARYKPHAKAGTVRRESERGIVPMIAATTQLGVGKAAHFGDARVARDG